MLYLILFGLYFIACLMVAQIAKGKDFGPGWAFVASFFFTPVIGLLFVALSKKAEEKPVAPVIQQTVKPYKPPSYKKIGLISLGVVAIYIAAGLFLKDSPEEVKIKKEIEALQIWKKRSVQFKGLSEDYLNDLNSIRSEVERAANGEHYDLKLMRAYFKNKAYYPDKMALAFDSLMNHHNNQFNLHTASIQDADRKIDSLNKLLE